MRARAGKRACAVHASKFRGGARRPKRKDRPKAACVFHGQIWEASASVARPFAQVFAHSWRTRFCLKLAPVALIERDQ